MPDDIDYLSYDETTDHLTIYEDADIAKTVDLGITLLHLNDKGEIVGLELMGVNETFDVPLDALTELAGARVELRYMPDNEVLTMKLALQFSDEEQQIPYAAQHNFGSEPFERTFATA